jgi:hypothetical protein
MLVAKDMLFSIFIPDITKVLMHPIDKSNYNRSNSRIFYSIKS